MSSDSASRRILYSPADEEPTMAFDAFMKIDVIPGQSRDEKHLDWIEILSYSIGVSTPSGGGRSEGGQKSRKCNHTDLTVMKAVDNASPKLFQFCVDGTEIAKIQVEFCKATGNKEKYLEYILEKVLIANVRPGGSAADDSETPLEEVSFNYGKLTQTYFQTDPKTGGPKGQISHTCTVRDEPD